MASEIRRVKRDNPRPEREIMLMIWWNCRPFGEEEEEEEGKSKEMEKESMYCYKNIT